MKQVCFHLLLGYLPKAPPHKRNAGGRSSPRTIIQLDGCQANLTALTYV